MKVSIVTVSYNSAATIGDTLASVAAQSHPDIEHLLVDGRSTDGTMDIVRRNGARLAKVLSEPDRGIYDAMNKGLAMATGDLIGFLNADDVLNGPDAIARLVDAARPAMDLVYADLVYVRGDDLTRVLRHWRSGRFRRSSLRLGWMPPHPTFYVRRELQRAVGGFDTRLRIAADYDFMLRCLSRPGIDVGYLPEVLVRMRTGGASNANLSSLVRKSREDLSALRRHGIGGWPTLIAKNLRKLPQFLGTSGR